MKTPFRCASVALFVCVASAARPALGDLTKAQCLEAHSSGQDLRQARKLAASLARFHQCADASCPHAVRADCTRWLEEVTAEQPTVVFDVKDGSGRDLSAVSVAMDGAPLADRLDGAALAVDPGEHTFVFTAAGQPPTTQTFVIKEGEKSRIERVVVGPAPAAPPAASPADLVPAASPTASSAVPAQPPATAAPAPVPPPQVVTLYQQPPEHPGGAQRGWGIASIVVGGVFVSLALANALFVKSRYDETNAPNECVNNVCTNQGLHDRSVDGTLADLSTGTFIGGAALLVGGILLVATAPSSRDAPRAAVGVTPGGLSVRGSW